jgi:hypothetical protein
LIHVGLLTAPFKLHWQKMYYKYIFYLKCLNFKRSSI